VERDRERNEENNDVIKTKTKLENEQGRIVPIFLFSFEFK